MTEQEFRQTYAAMAGGDPEALSALYAALAPCVYAIALSVAGQPADAEDVVSEVFLRLWQRRNPYTFRGKHRSWISTVAYHAAVDRLRRGGREAWEGEELLEALPCPPEEERLCDRLTLAQALAALPEAQRQVVALHVVSDLPLRETARLLGRPLGTVASQHRDAMKRLRNILTG